MENSKKNTGVNLVEIGLQFGIIIALPLILFIGLGFWLDKKYGTVPLFIIIGLFLALAISAYGLYKRIREIFSELNIPKK